MECSTIAPLDEIPPCELIMPNPRRLIDRVLTVFLHDILEVEINEENLRKLTRVCTDALVLEDVSEDWYFAGNFLFRVFPYRFQDLSFFFESKEIGERVVKLIQEYKPIPNFGELKFVNQDEIENPVFVDGFLSKIEKAINADPELNESNIEHVGNILNPKNKIPR